MKLPAKLIGSVQGIYLRGFDKYAAQATSYTHIDTTGYVEATVKSEYANSMSYQTLLADDITTVSVQARNLSKIFYLFSAKFSGVSVAFDVNPTGYTLPSGHDEIHVVSKVEKIDTNLVLLDCKMYDTDAKNNLIVQISHTKYFPQ